MFILDENLIEIILLSLQVSLTAVLISMLIALPLGAILALSRFPGRTSIIILINSLMSLPPVVVGLSLYILLSRSGPLGVLNLLYTPTAMIIAQVILVTPIITALTRQTMEDLWQEYREQLLSFRVRRFKAVKTLLWDGRFSLLTSISAGFGRAISEVGAVMIVGGNIDHLTRVMTTAITLETNKGNLEAALSLGIVLLILALGINIMTSSLKAIASKGYH